MHINYLGLFNSPVSWAKVLRNYALYTKNASYKVTIIPRKGYFYQSTTTIEPRIKSLPILDKQDIPDVQIAFEYPENYKYMRAKLKVGLLVYETDILPDNWIKNINRYLDLLIVPSYFTYRIFKNNNIKIPIEIVPYGVETNRYIPLNKKPQKITFLHIALPHKRKATHIVVSTFKKLFSNASDIQLILKFPGQRKAKAPWEHDILLPQDLNNVSIVAKALTEDEMVDLYNRCTVYIQPSYSEGFGLSILEAFSCEKPAIVTAYGGHMDFCSPNNSFLLDFHLVPAGEIQYDIKKIRNPAKIAEPDENSLIKKLKDIVTRYPASITDKKTFCRETALKYDWEKVTGQLLETVQHYLCLK